MLHWQSLLLASKPAMAIKMNAIPLVAGGVPLGDLLSIREPINPTIRKRIMTA